MKLHEKYAKIINIGKIHRPNEKEIEPVGKKNIKGRAPHDPSMSNESCGAAVVGWRRGVAVECRIRDQEVGGSSLGRALWCKNSGQVSHTYVPLLPSSITWYWSKGGDA